MALRATGMRGFRNIWRASGCEEADVLGRQVLHLAGQSAKCGVQRAVGCRMRQSAAQTKLGLFFQRQ